MEPEETIRLLNEAFVHETEAIEIYKKQIGLIDDAEVVGVIIYIQKI